MLHLPCLLQIAPCNDLFHHNNHPHILKKQQISFKQMGGPLLFFHSDTNPVLGHVLVYYVDKTHVLVATLKLNWLLFLDILCSNTQKVSLVHKIQKKLCKSPYCRSNQSFTAFSCWMCSVQSGHVRFFFCCCFFPMIMNLRILFLLSTPVARMLLASRRVSRRKDLK